MRKIVIFIVMVSSIWANDAITYKGYGEVSIMHNDTKLPLSGEVNNNTQVVLDGKGKVVFFYPCGAPKVLKVRTKKTLRVHHECKDNSVAQKLLSNFFDNWFKEDEKIVIAASSRATNNVKRGYNYFVVGKESVDAITIPLYDEDAEYKVVINNKEVPSSAIKADEKTLSIDTDFLDKSRHNRVEIYEDGIKVYDFIVDVISKDMLMQKYPSSQLSLFEKALRYAKDTKKQLYIKNLNTLLEGK